MILTAILAALDFGCPWFWLPLILAALYLPQMVFLKMPLKRRQAIKKKGKNPSFEHPTPTFSPILSND